MLFEWFTCLGLLAGGLIILACGGELLVRGAAQLARQWGVSALVVGLTIVAFGTSSPEIAVSLKSALVGEHDLAVANVVGSCIMNILVVLGLAAVARPLRVSRNVITTDAPFMLFFTAMFVLFAIDEQVVRRWQGLIFIAALAVYTLFTYFESRRHPKIVEAEYESDKRMGFEARSANLAAIIVGIAGLKFGADLIVGGAVGIATLLHVSTRIIGLTVVAFGTSLPELATCVIAAWRNQPDIAIGNVVGSNIFNILAVVGATAVCVPLEISTEILYFDVPVMLGVVVLSFYVLRTGHRISRPEGAGLLLLYGAYLAWTLR